jgi:hypothetical protein
MTRQIERHMRDERGEGRQATRADMRQCSTCQRMVPTSEGVYIGGGRWCCFPCAAALYSDDDDDEDE